MKVACLFIVVLACAQAHDDWRIVNINQGPVKGYKSPSYDVFAFYEIPYATAPTGTERFKGPLPPPNWTEPFEAVERKIICPHYNTANVAYTEDCLVASVYVPDTDATNLPVVFYIHGGGFQRGSGNSDTPFQFVNYKKNIIFVTFNYRVGPHGFLCLGTKDVPGNGGMKDQVAALRWVHENIAAFGGNPDNVTIAGCSAGGASVDLLTLSKTVNGLYNKAIAQSGAGIGAFAVQVDPIENARNYAKDLNYTGPDNLASLEEFYKNLTYEDLLSINLGDTKDVSVVFSACVERDLGEERFLEDTPINIIKRGDYIRRPMLYGWANKEGLYRLPNFEDWKVAMNKDFTEFLPADLRLETYERKTEIAQQLKEFYFGDSPVNDDNILRYLDFHSDAMFIVAIQREVTLKVEAGYDAIYLSAYSYVLNMTAAIPYTNAMGATHCTQTRIIFDHDENLLPPEDVAWKRTMRDLWLNFILTGEPTPDTNIPEGIPKWEPASADRTPCVELGSYSRVLPGPFAKDRQAVWDGIYDKFQREPVAPYDF